MAIYSWAALVVFVGLFDPVLRWRLNQQRKKVAVLA
jgi:hypothetical protein